MVNKSIADKSLMKRDGQLESAWQGIPEITSTPYGDGTTDTLYDCVVIGGGITGLTAALLLQKSGKRTLLAEAHTVGFGTTGGTSAHINTFADTPYQDVESSFGKKGAQLFADAINEGLRLIEDNVKAYSIDCDYETKTGYIYAEDEDQAKDLDDIYKGTLKVGVTVEYTDHVPCPVPFKRALQLAGQAQFHPLKYLQGLQKAYVEAGGIIIENTRVEEIKTEGKVHFVVANKMTVRASNVIYATHMPPNINAFNFRCAPYRSYVIAVTLKGNYPDGLIYDMQDPYHYTRTHMIDGQQLLLVGGSDHKTAHDDSAKAMEDLEQYIRKYYDVEEVKFRWSSQYYVPVDGLPYTGQMPFEAEGIYCATGYNGNGMMLGTISGKVLSDLILKSPSPYKDIFDPKRIKPIDGFTEFMKENADVAYHFIADRINIKETESLKTLPPGTGKVVEVNGQKVAAYCDESGNIHALSPVCTHTKCIVIWNPDEKSWDCPCHGARYDIDGKVITGPATRDLQSISI